MPTNSDGVFVDQEGHKARKVFQKVQVVDGEGNPSSGVVDDQGRLITAPSVSRMTILKGVHGIAGTIGALDGFYQGAVHTIEVLSESANIYVEDANGERDDINNVSYPKGTVITSPSGFSYVEASGTDYMVAVYFID